MHSALGNFTSDVFRILSVVGAYEFAGGGLQFCSQHFVRPKACPRYMFPTVGVLIFFKAMEEIHKLRAQISNIVQANFPSAGTGFVPKLVPPNELQVRYIFFGLAQGP